MNTKSGCGRLDSFRIIAAVMVIAIHTSPLSTYNGELDFFLTRVVSRLAVPFFFMVTGQFVLSSRLWKQEGERVCLLRYLLKLLGLYGASILLYIPIGIYAGHYQGLTLSSALRMLIFDGTFYHLWYFPAVILGILLLCALERFFTLRTSTCIAAVLYVIGLLGDSWYGLICHVPVISAAYEWALRIFSYTRNGLFMAPLFLIMGVWIGRQNQLDSFHKVLPNVLCFAVFLLLMGVEGFVLHFLDVQRHDSMYLFLPLCILPLYRLLLCGKSKSHKALRTVSTWLYILHPAMIVVVRGAAKAFRMTELLVDNSLMHFAAVCFASAVAALSVYGLTVLLHGFRKPTQPPAPAASFRRGKLPTSAFSSHRYSAARYPKGRAWIELDTHALQENVNTLRTLLPEGCALMPALKADAYGHGAVLMARELNAMGVNAFCVACISEGIRLRKHGIKGEILILGYTHPQQFPLLRRYRLTQTVIDYAYALKLNRYGKRLRVHVAIDTGMHRLGERAEHREQLCKIFAMKNLNIQGAFTHLCADDTDNPKATAFTKGQAEAFFTAVEYIKKQGCSCPKVHLQSSYGVLNYPRLAGDYARVGIALYGVRSSLEDLDKASPYLRPVLSLKARISSVKVLYPGESAGYGLTFTADRQMKIATLAIGYGDGLPRSLSCGAGCVLINGCKAAIVGRICMDQTLVDVTDIPNVYAGEVAVIIGRSGDEEITVYELAEKTGTITNEVLSRLGGRLERVAL